MIRIGQREQIAQIRFIHPRFGLDDRIVLHHSIVFGKKLFPLTFSMQINECFPYPTNARHVSHIVIGKYLCIDHEVTAIFQPCNFKVDRQLQMIEGSDQFFVICLQSFIHSRFHTPMPMLHKTHLFGSTYSLGRQTLNRAPHLLVP